MRLLWASTFFACVSASAQTIDYAQQVHPILAARCMSCHNGKAGQGGLSLAARQDMLRGGASGPVLVPGDSANSLLLQRITGAKAPRMPMAGDPLPEASIAIIRKWIDEGARVNPNAAPAAVHSFSLSLKPPAQGGIDELLEPYYKQHRVQPAAPVSDALFIRRAYLDLWGLLPPPEKQKQFIADTRPDKRRLLVDELLANQRNYAEHWISFWNDLLHNDEGVVYHGERSSITPWLLSSLEKNQPYDAFVRELLAPAPKGPSAGFIQGVTWRGTVNASQTPPMQAAQNSAQVFLGINLKCNSCHDSFISHWKLREAYALASFFSHEPLEIVRCDVSTGQTAKPAFLFSELGNAPQGDSLEERRAAAAHFFTTRENGLFARTIVNRVWRLLFGRGLVEPLDEMEGPSWHPQLLEWLSADFVQSGYDMKHLLRTIMNSKAWQRPSVPAGNPRDPEYVFSGPWPRRLTSEQFADSIASLTGEWRVRVDNRPVPGMYAREWRFKANSMTRALGRPVRDGAVTERQTESTTLQALELTNGRTINQWLMDGAARMTGAPDPAPPSLFDSGLMRSSSKVEVDLDIQGRKQLRLLVVDVDSYDPARVKVHWGSARLLSENGETPLPATAVLGREFLIDLSGKRYTRFRATLFIDPSSNQSDISPAVRAFIFESAPNMRKLVAASGEPPVARTSEPSNPSALVNEIFQYAYSRPPRPAEMSTALSLVAAAGKPNREGLQDFLWTVFMSPEFQFIR